MDSQSNTAVTEKSQSPIGPQPIDLAPSDRHLLFRSTLSLLLRRANHHVPVTVDDLIRLLPYAYPDERERAA